MTDAGTPPDLATLEPLEPLDTGMAGGGPGMDDPALQVLRSGLGAPAFNPYCRDKTFYRFLFAGVVMLVGCLLPWNANLAQAGYQTVTGGVYLLLSIAMIWTWWGAIQNNRSTGASLKWLLLSAFPLVTSLMNMMAFDPTAAFEAAKAAGWLHATAVAPSAGWKEVFGDIGAALAKDAEAADRVTSFWRVLGPGQLFLFFGGLLAEMGFFGGVLGGAKKNKQDKQQKQMAAAERKRR